MNKIKIWRQKILSIDIWGTEDSDEKAREKGEMETWEGALSEAGSVIRIGGGLGNCDDRNAKRIEHWR